jgi:hypothetical protein
MSRSDEIELNVVEILIRFRESTRSNEFSYHQMMKWYERNRRRLRLPWVHWHTFERKIRDLRERGYLERHVVRNRAIFHIKKELYNLRSFLERKVMASGA